MPAPWHVQVQFEHTLSTGGGVEHRVELAGAAPAISLADGGNITAQSSVSLQHRRKTAGDAEARLHVAPGQANFTAASIACGAGAASFVAASSSVFRIEADAVRLDSATVSTPKATVDRLASAEGTRREPFNPTPMAVNSISSGSPHVRPMWALSTCGA